MRYEARIFDLMLEHRAPGKSRRWTLAALACSAVLSIQMLGGPAMAQPQQPRLAPVQNEGTRNQIPGQYIVVFNPGTARNVVAAAQERVKALGGTVIHTYTSALVGFSVRMPQERAQAQRAMEVLRALPGVSYIEADQTVSINSTINQAINPATDNLGLDRITQRLLPLDSSYNYDGMGAGVHVFVIDTGIRETHVEFGGRASWLFDAIGGNVDCHGHGTNVAGIIGATTFGVAKQVTLHAVRVLNCAGSGTGADAIAGVNAVTTWKGANPALPAVANMSLGAAAFAALDTAVNNSIAAGVTYVVAAGNNGADACGFSPARVPNAITVGNANPADDTQWTGAFPSNFGPCLDLYAPGVAIRSTGNASNTATSVFTGTSQASPHVAGVAARHLSSFPTKTPAQVWAQIDLIANVSPGTAGWPGIGSLGVGSPNKLLVWMAVDDAHDDGDPHVTTVRGINYDFQGAGEFVVLRDGNGLQIQTRQSPVTTQPPIANPYTGLATCVSLNTAVAARVGTRRVTYQPSSSGSSANSGLQLRVDGVLTTLGAQGVTLGPGARVVKTSVGNGIEIDFPDGTALTALSNFWGPPHNRWYLNVSVFHTTASEGIMGALAPGSWLPALPDGSSLGPKPASNSQRYSDLYGKFGNAWRVTSATSLFDYASGTSTATFTLANWPPENPPCVVPDSPATKPVSASVAQNACAEIRDKNRQANCIFDVGITGELGFAKLYQQSEQIRTRSTRTIVNASKTPTQRGESVKFIATVSLKATGSTAIPKGTVQFTLDGAKAGEPVKLNAKGQAVWTTQRLTVGDHRVGALYTPARGSAFLASSGLEQAQAVKEAAKVEPR